MCIYKNQKINVWTEKASILYYGNFLKNLQPYGYMHITHTLGLWNHQNKQINYCLCVDDFEVKYFNKSDAIHLLQTLQNNYTALVDWSGEKICGIAFNWKYHNGYVDV